MDVLHEMSRVLIKVWTQPIVHTNLWVESGMNASLCIKVGEKVFMRAKTRVYIA